MSITNELTRDILNFFFECRVFAYRQNSTGIYDQRAGIYRPAAKTGLTDIVAILPTVGVYCGVELKVGKDKLRPEQIGTIKNIKDMGGVAFVAKDWPNFMDQIKPVFETYDIKIPIKYADYNPEESLLRKK
jgi:hypothetical protein